MTTTASTRRSRRSTFGTLRQRKSGSWQVLVSTDTGGRESLGTYATREQAELELAQYRLMRQSSGGGVNPQAGNLLFGHYSERYVSTRPNLAPTTRSQYQTLLRVHILPTFGDRHIGTISREDVEGWYNALSKGVAPGAYQLLRAIMRRAVESRIIRETPCKIKGGGESRSPERRPPTPEQVAAVIPAMPERLRLAIYVAAFGGLRVGELLGLERADVTIHDEDEDPAEHYVTIRVERQLQDLDGRLLICEPKSDAGRRSVDLPAPLVPIVKAHLSTVGPAPDAPVFVSPRGKRLRPYGLGTAWRKARESVGMDEVHMHDLRHFALTTLAHQGATPRELMDIGGHSNVKMVMRYQHVADDRRRFLAQAAADFVPVPS